MRRLDKVVVLILLLTASCLCLNAQNFVSVRDGKFELDNKPYYFIGANMWYGCYLGSEKVPGGRQRLVRELDAMKQQGILNLRVLGSSENSKFENHFPFFIQKSPAEYDEEVLSGLDFLLAEMKKREMKAVIYLNNYWGWSGGMAQYVTWANPELASSVPYDPARRWEREMILSSYFYKETYAKENFRKYIETVVLRKNTFTGLRYSDDPTIMAWQLCNEPRPGPDGSEGDKNIPAFVEWIDQTAGYIHSLDRNHLVSSGNEGKVGTIQNISYYEQSHSSKNIDYLTLHIWPKNWGWFDAEDPHRTFPIAIKNSLEHFRLHIDLATKMNKPLVMEEFGLDRDQKSCEPGTPAKMRDEYFGAMFKLLYEQARLGKCVAGANFWAWGGEGNPMAAFDKPITSSNYVGDPFVEPQGLNSVFSKDLGTLKIIRKYNQKLRSLSRLR